MGAKRVVLVTGVAGYWGAHVAEKLINQPGYHIIGTDHQKPKEQIKGLDFIRADIRSSLFVELLKSENVHTVCHLTFNESCQATESTFDLNVIGTMKVLGAGAEAGVQKIILKSSTAVYGAQPGNSAFLTEEHPLNGSLTYGYTRDMVEIEAFCAGYRGQYPEMSLSLLRFANILGMDVDTPMTQFLLQTSTPVLLGFDPMMQIIHAQDAIDALVHAVSNDHEGVFNVAADSPLPLSRVMAMAGKPPMGVFHPIAYWGAGLVGRGSSRMGRYLPIEPDYLRYPWVGDTQKMRQELLFEPRYTAEETLREFAGRQRLRRYQSEPDDLPSGEERLSDTLERRRRIRESTAEGRADDLGGDGHD